LQSVRLAQPSEMDSGYPAPQRGVCRKNKIEMKKMKEGYGTLLDTINGLKKEGYSKDFNVSDKSISGNREMNFVLSPQEFEIDKVYRFEGASNPDDQSILYAISSKKFNLKGILVNGYGISADDVTNALIAKLSVHPVDGYQRIYGKTAFSMFRG
jgi:hypothetical protein